MSGLQHVPKPSRVLVYLRSSSESTYLRAASFGQCILKYFGYGDVNSGLVTISLEENKLILDKANKQDKPNLKENSFTTILRHPSLCPAFHIQPHEYDVLPLEVKERGVDVGVAVLLTSVDNHVMVTRRSARLRTFPGVWVPPGGHVELGEDLITAGLRELHEETGLALGDPSSHILGLWESVYPHMLAAGQPMRQHIVAYFAVESSLTWRELLSNIQLNYEETDAALWLPVSLAEKMSSGRIAGDEALPEQVTILFKHEDGQQEAVDIPTDQLLQLKTPPPDLDPVDLERITWGTMFALQQWVVWRRSKSNKKCNL